MFIDANFYNGNLDRFAFVRVVIEFLPSTGTYTKYIQTSTFRIPHYQEPGDRFILFLEILVYLYLAVAFFARELFEVTWSLSLSGADGFQHEAHPHGCPSI